MSDVDLYSDDSGAGKSYANLLARPDIGALVIGYVLQPLLSLVLMTPGTPS